MTSIKLKDLFACSIKGGSLIAEYKDSSLIHIEDVPSGLACGCRCPGCGHRMVAKKGPIQAHHFAHHADSSKSCSSASETALHKFAKEILNQSLEITLPDRRISRDGLTEDVVSRGLFRFEEAILERKVGTIVPDVVLILKNRKLIVEFKVTHSCDAEKIRKIRSMNVGAIEIDLSGYRDKDLSDLREEILHSAPREWLHNPKEAAAHQRLEAKVTIRNQERESDALRLLTFYRQRPSQSAERNKVVSNEIREAGLESLVGKEVNGSGCFLVPSAEWQAAILLVLLDSKSLSIADAKKFLSERDWLKPELRGISDELATDLVRREATFAFPVSAIRQYLKILEHSGFIYQTVRNRWLPSDTLTSKVATAYELKNRPRKRLLSIQTAINGLISSLPLDELGSFSFSAWSKKTLPGRSYSVEEALGFEEPEWSPLESEITQLAGRLRRSPEEEFSLLNLPLQKERERQAERKRHEDEEQEKDKQAKLEEEASLRVADITQRARRLIPHAADEWLNTPIDSSENSTPVDTSRASEGGLLLARRQLQDHAADLEEKERAEIKRKGMIDKLTTMARSRYVSSDHAELWLRSRRRELGGLSPVDFVADEKTYQRCVGLLPAKKSRR